MNPADLTESFEIFQEAYNDIRTFRAVIMPQTNQLLRMLDAHDRTIVAQDRTITALSGRIGTLNDEIRSLNIIVHQLSQNPQPQANDLPPPPPVPAPGADDTLPLVPPVPCLHLLVPLSLLSLHRLVLTPLVSLALCHPLHGDSLKN